MLKRLSAALAAIVCAAGIAWGANITQITGPQDPSQLSAVVNGVIQNINTSLGRIGVGTTAVSTGATTAETTLQQYTLPGGTLANAGDSLRVTCWGNTATSGGTKTMKLYFGSTSFTTPTAATSNKGWSLNYIVTRRTATTQAFNGNGIVDTTPVTPSTTDAAETLASGITIKCTGTNGNSSASDITAQGLLVEAIR